jgi:Uma2 family endonuclease
MASTARTATQFETFAELLERIGDVPPDRIRMQPPPGTATEKDVIRAMEAPRKRLCELVDGVLVEKAVGMREALLAGVILKRLWEFVGPDDLGVVLPADASLRLMPGLVRFPDVSFISWGTIGADEVPKEPVPDLAPDLAVEVISEGNTKKEMERKLRDYFVSGVRLVWLVYPKTQTAEAYTAPDEVRRVGKNQALDGGDVLSGFRLPLKDLFAGLKRRKR